MDPTLPTLTGDVGDVGHANAIRARIVGQLETASLLALHNALSETAAEQKQLRDNVGRALTGILKERDAEWWIDAGSTSAAQLMINQCPELGTCL